MTALRKRLILIDNSFHFRENGIFNERKRIFVMSNLSFGAGYWKKQLPLTVLSYLSSFIAIVTDLSLPLLTAAMLDYAVC